MVSMVIVLFLVAVVISLFLGRLAETLTEKFRERSQPSQAARTSVGPAGRCARQQSRIGQAIS